MHGVDRYKCRICTSGFLDLSTDEGSRQKRQGTYDSSVKGLSEEQENALKEMQEDVRLNRCPTCKTSCVPDPEAVTFSGPNKGQWDGHTYKGNCDHFPPHLRIIIG